MRDLSILTKFQTRDRGVSSSAPLSTIRSQRSRKAWFRDSASRFLPRSIMATNIFFKSMVVYAWPLQRQVPTSRREGTKFPAQLSGIKIPPFYSPSVFGLCPSNGLRPLSFPLCLNASQKYPYLFGRSTYIKIENNHRLLGQLSKDTFRGIWTSLEKCPTEHLTCCLLGILSFPDFTRHFFVL